METIDLLLQQNAKQFQEIRQLLELIIRQNQNNNPNPNLEASLLHNKSLSVKFTNFLQDSFSDIYDKLKDIENKSTKEEQISYKENFESLKNQADQILGVLNLINNKETEKLADNFKAIEEKLSKLIEVSDKEVYSDKKVIAEISLLCDEVEKVKDSIKPFDFEKLSDIQSANFEKILKHNFSVDLDKYQKPKNALAVKIYDKDGNVIERFGGGGSGGYPDVSIKNIAGAKINPATNEKLDEVITALGAVSIDTTGLATSAKQLPDGHAVVIKNSVGVVQDWDEPQGQRTSATSMPMVLSTEQEALLQAIKNYLVDSGYLAQEATLRNGDQITGLRNASSATLINPATEDKQDNIITAITNGYFEVVGLKDSSETRINPATADNQQTDALTDSELRATPVNVKNKYVLPLSSNNDSTKTLTNANTAYQITTIPSSDYLLILCNMSDTDMFWGFSALTSGGNLLMKNGDKVEIPCAASQSVYFYCASAGKVINYSTTVL